MPGQPAAGVGVDVLAVAQVEHLVLEYHLGVGVRPRTADLAPEDDRGRHSVVIGDTTLTGFAVATGTSF